MIWLLTWLLFAIASLDAFHQSQNACSAVQEKAGPAILHYTNTVAQTIKALNRLDITACANSIIYWYHLMHIIEYYIKQKE